MSQVTLAVFIGRFSPFHNGHLKVLKHAAKKYDAILALVGSAFRPRSFKNPWTFAERRQFILSASADILKPLTVLPLIDTLYDDDAWQINVRTAVNMHIRNKGLRPENVRVVLVGFEKDKSSRYLNWFPGWEVDPVETPHTFKKVVLNATDLRNAIFLNGKYDELSDRFGAISIDNIVGWMNNNQANFELIKNEAQYSASYKNRIAQAEAAFGYPIQINCVDNVVIQNGHVLLIVRKMAPGKGLLALPGGHLGEDIFDEHGNIVGTKPEKSIDAAIRELYEETRLDLPRQKLRSSVRRSQIFDHPDRSERGWVRTEAFLIQLENRKELEKVKASSDAVDARWVPLHELTPDNMFEDHFDIIQAMAPNGIPFTYSSLLLPYSQ